MLIGQSVLTSTTPGAVYYSPWFPRQADQVTVVVEVMADSGGSYTLKVGVETKNSEDSDSALTALSDSTGTGVGQIEVPASGCLELVRMKFTAIASTQQWVHFRANPPIWQPN